MRILVAIANFGISNDHYLAELLRIYRGMRHQVHVVVLTDKPKDLGSDIEVIAGLPENPRALPFGHKQIFADRIDQYDLFIYSEDDTPVTERNIEAYLRVTDVLPENEIAGFFRTETDGQGNVYYSTVHSYFHWVPGSVRRCGQYTFAIFTNDHSACYLLTREQLKRAIASGGFLVEPHDGKYSLMVSAATDPYTQCGFTKVICISHLEDFITPHLPNKYIGRLGLSKDALDRQLRRLREVQDNPSLHRPLLEVETKVRYCRWAKDYYEHSNPELIRAVPEDARTVLSIGCGWGAAEGELVRKGKQVTALPLDSVVAACCETVGIELIHGSLNDARRNLEGRRFDCLLLSNILHVVKDPQGLLQAYGPLVGEGGSIVILTPNFGYLPTMWKRFKGHPDFRDLGDYSKTRIHTTTPGLVRSWLANVNYRIDQSRSLVAKRFQTASSVTLGLADGYLAEDLVVRARRAHA